MRWRKLRSGDTRVIKRFAIFPISAGGEVRWLEWVTIRQYAYDVDYYFFPWHNAEFIDDFAAK